MNDKEWNNLNKHIKNKFQNNEKIKTLNFFPNKKEIDELNDNKIYKLSYSCIAVDIVNSKNKLNEFESKNWSKMISEFAYGITKIMKIYKAKYIRIQGDSVYAIFDTKTKEQIDLILDCCVELNTFKTHLNKQIYKFLFNTNDSNKIIVDYGIGAWFSFDNYISIIGSSKSRDIIFMGDSVNYANELSKKASRDNKSSILFNNLIYSNLTNEFKKNNKDIWDFYEYNDILSQKIFGCNWIFTKYLNWIKNNS